MRDSTPTFFLIFAIMAIGLGGIISTLRVVDAKKPYPYKQLLTDAGNVDVLINLEQLIKDHGDDSRLLRYVDKDANVVIYLTQNSTGDMFTSMQAIPLRYIDRSDLWKRILQ